MRKAILVMLVVGCSLGITGSAFAKAYLAANVAYVELNDEVITDSSASGLNGAEISFYGGQGTFLAVGSELKGFRYEGELSYTKDEMDSIAGAFGTEALKGEVTSISLMGNVFKDFETKSAFSPFVGLGIGASQLDGELAWWSGSPPLTADGGNKDIVFAYQIMLGCGYEASETITLDISYRYFATTDPTFGTVETEISYHNLLVGIRVAF